MKIKTIHDIPKALHYAAIIVKTESIHHEGDERSRTNPGHGYPAYTENRTTVEYLPFEFRGEMEAWVKDAEMRADDKPTYRIVEVNPLEVSIYTSIRIAEKDKNRDLVLGDLLKSWKTS